MNKADFQKILRMIDNVFYVRKIGSTGKSWIAIGELFEGSSVEEIQRELRDLPIKISVRHNDGMVWLTVEDKSKKPLMIPPINLILFLVTIITTMVAGSLIEGGNPFSHWTDIAKGFPFSVALMLILGCHEFGHYYFARKNNIEATLPYFIPVPPPLFFIGTFGAFIRIKSPIDNRNALLEIGASGPIAGFIVSVLAIILGYTLIPDQQSVINHIEQVHTLMGLDSQFSQGIQLSMGTSLLFSALSSAFDATVPMNEIYHFPLIFAGWIGILVTMLNLLPIGQLDGGHVAYAVFGEKHNKMAKWIFLMLIPLGFISSHWWFWAFLILILMRTVKHPPIWDMRSPLIERDKIIGFFCLIIFALCFSPIPIRVI